VFRYLLNRGIEINEAGVLQEKHDNAIGCRSSPKIVALMFIWIAIVFSRMMCFDYKE
jgi:hypothetical protein